MEEKQIALEVQKVSKKFGSIQANKAVDLTVYKGEIHVVLGENGSGKTTLMNMIAGIYFPDSGKIFVNGEEKIIRSPKDAFDNKIGMVHQHYKLIELFSAAENIVLGIKNKEKFDEKKIVSRVEEIAHRYGFSIDPKKKVYEMSVSEKQTVEIIKVLYRDADILILDEPTAVLTPQETEKLFNVLRVMKNDGKSIILITHKLNEVMAVSDRVTILRKGRYIDTVETSQTNENELTEMMVGKKIELNINRSEPVNPRPRIVCENLCCKDKDGLPILKNVSFTANGGEILGIAGIAGSGQRELLEAVAGLQPLTSGTIIFHNPKENKPVTFFHKDLKQIKELAKEHKFHYEDGTVVDLTEMHDKEISNLVNEGKLLFYEDEIMNLRDKTPLQIRELGVKLSFVPEDRLGMGLVGNMNITDNMMLRSYRKGGSIFLNRHKPQDLAEHIVEELEVATPGVTVPVRRLSGGNVQKVLVGREISSSPKVLMAAYPVRGLDINSSYLIYNLLNKQKETGTAVIYVGEDLDVLLGLCDRILVINSGVVTGIVDARNITKQEVGYLMTKVLDSAPQTETTQEEGGDVNEA
ncbi:MAG: ABC transporter ATP-binding protein [Clostridiales bacterium]|nr:ABC transporter ATP-binding protein [Clostridiales bacterium]